MVSTDGGTDGAQVEAGAGAAPAGDGAPGERGGRGLRDGAIAIAVVVLGVLALKTLPLPPSGALAAFILLGLGALAVGGRSRTDYGLRWPPDVPGGHTITIAATVMGPTLALASAQIVRWITLHRWLSPGADLKLDLIPYFFGVHALWAAFPEEILFRGYLQTQLRAAFRGEPDGGPRATAAVIVVALVYLLVHVPVMNPESLLGAGILGLLLGCLRERTGSLVAPFMCHAAYNAALAWLEVAYH